MKDVKTEDLDWLTKDEEPAAMRVVSDISGLEVDVNEVAPDAKCSLIKLTKNGKTLTIDIVDGVMDVRGDVPINAAAYVFFEALTNIIVKYMELRAQITERDRLL